MCKVYTGDYGTSEIEHGLCACAVDNPLAKARDYLSIQARTMLFILSHIVYRSNFIKGDLDNCHNCPKSCLFQQCSNPGGRTYVMTTC